jgi:hypothetical protein
MDRVVDITARACDAVGRDPKSLDLTGWARLVLEEDGTALARAGCLSGSPAEVAATVRGFVEAGLRHLTFYIGAPDDPSRLPALTAATMARFASVLEAIRAG